MPIDWSALPASSGILEKDGLPEHFGDLPAELSAAATPHQALVAVIDRAWIRCSGPDARVFLHNQLTSDVNHLALGHWQHSAWCTAKGRILANFIIVHQSPECFDLCLPTELAASIAKRLKMYVLRAKVLIEDRSEQVHTLGFRGNLNSGLGVAKLPVPAAAGAFSAFDQGWVVRTAEDACLIALNDAAVNHYLLTLSPSARLTGKLAWHWLEVNSGRALVRQQTQEEFVPQMVNFDKIGGVSFHKGCYPGQEVVARTQYLGKVKRHLYKVHSTQLLSAGQALYSPPAALSEASESVSGGGCGVIANAAPSPQGGWDGLAVILENAVGQAVHVGAPNGPNLSNIDLVAA